jgi:RND family efflux transporter MFP subunit
VATQSPPDARGDFLGVIIPATSVDIAPKFEGRLESLSVQLGDKVAAGAVLARLDVVPLRKELAIAQATLQTARAQEQVSTVALHAAQDRVHRIDTPGLASIQAIPAEEIAAAHFEEQTAAAKLSAAQAQVQEQLARVEQIQQQLADATLTAPFDGVVSARYLDPGALTAQSRPVLRLLSSGELKVRFAIPEDEVSKVSPGATVRIRVHPTQVLKGTVESVAPEVDAASRMIFALARLETAPGPSVPAGQVARVLVGQAEPQAEATASGMPR